MGAAGGGATGKRIRVIQLEEVWPTFKMFALEWNSQGSQE